jgi:hypothetical protein
MKDIDHNNVEDNPMENTHKEEVGNNSLPNIMNAGGDISEINADLGN